MSIFAIGDLHLAMDPRVEKPMDIFGEEWVDPVSYTHLAGIEYRTKRTGQSRLIKFIRHDGGDANDGTNGI